jgi:glycosyltransferase involved in cell wall biosynthesis
MKIAQIAPLIESVPPRLYGGTERIVSYLTEELVGLGHDVTLFASGDSMTSARLVPCCPKALRLSPAVRDTVPYYMIMLDRVRRMAAEFDVLHFHIDMFQFPIFHEESRRALTTLHGRQDLPDLQQIYRAFPEMPLVSISEAQRRPIAGANFAGTVLHGLPLKIAAKVDRNDEDYFRSQLEHLLKQPGVEFIGEIGEHDKTRFLGEALALLFPIDWPEPFGVVMIEAMACGTPVLAFRNGSVPEVIDEGVTGYSVDSVDAALRVMGRVLALDRRTVRRRFEERFSAERMARDYVRLYQTIAGERAKAPVELGEPMVQSRPARLH